MALLAGMTWLWLLALGWVGPDTVPMEGLRGLSGYCWAMQAAPKWLSDSVSEWVGE